MPDVLGGDDQDHRKDDQDGLEIKLWSRKVWQGKDRSGHDSGKVQDPGNGRSHVSGDHGDQDRDHSIDPAAEGYPFLLTKEPKRTNRTFLRHTSERGLRNDHCISKR